MNRCVKSFNKRTIQTINNLNVMLRKLTVKVDADISSLLFQSSFHQSSALGRPSGSLSSHRAAMTGARCVARPHVDRVLTLVLMRDFRKCRGQSCGLVASETLTLTRNGFSLERKNISLSPFPSFYLLFIYFHSLSLILTS